jgi:hypothetical protein
MHAPHRAALLALAVLVVGPGTTAFAQDAEDAGVITFAAPISRPLYVGGGLGFSAGLNGGGVLFKLQEEIGWQMDPIQLGSGSNVVLRLGGDLAQQFGDAFIFQFGARFTAAFALWTNGEMTVRIAPSLMLGAAILNSRICTPLSGCGDYTSGAFNIQFATQAELELLEGVLSIWLRPIAIDGFIADNSGARWDILAGVDVHI